ncbi:MAG: mannose-1-phosphate guanylyltransferase, partial [Candidatus Cloacimonadota bacterium]|nr:mannose-1-phosphate guanylyltransferase [Candidatus Cloacimonadota bacterium]
DQKPLVLEQIEEFSDENIIVEPFGMNTAPCIALSALYLEHKFPYDSMLVVPADHLIIEEDKFWKSVEIGAEAIKQNYLVTFGIRPTYPATGYGYIETEKMIAEDTYSVKRFKEKPNFDTAKEFIDDGKFLWNSGMFLWKISTIIQEFGKYLPNVITLLNKIAQKWDADGFGVDISIIYKEMPRLPIDIAVMEQAKKRAVIPVDYGWSDVGSWRALYDVLEKDDNGNVIDTESSIIDSNRNLVFSHKHVSLIDIDDIVIIDTKDALLVSKRSSSEKVKQIVEKLKKENEKLL